MNTVPAWLVVGAEAAIVCTEARALSYSPVTIEKIGKRDVVCSNGARFTVTRLSSSTGDWGPTSHLVERDDPKATEALVRVLARRRENRAIRAYEDWARDRTTENADAVVAAFTAILDQEA